MRVSTQYLWLARNFRVLGCSNRIPSGLCTTGLRAGHWDTITLTLNRSSIHPFAGPLLCPCDPEPLVHSSHPCAGPLLCHCDLEPLCHCDLESLVHSPLCRAPPSCVTVTLNRWVTMTLNRSSIHPFAGPVLCHYDLEPFYHCDLEPFYHCDLEPLIHSPLAGRLLCHTR